MEVGAILGLAGFLLAFTYSIAGSQFDSRRLLMIQDANAIGTAFLKMSAADEYPHSVNRPYLCPDAARVWDSEECTELAVRHYAGRVAANIA